MERETPRGIRNIFDLIKEDEKDEEEFVIFPRSAKKKKKANVLFRKIK